jgi:hypothetical protein
MPRRALAIFLLLLGIYLLTSGGHFYAVDEERMFEVTGSLARYGSFALNPDQPGPPQYSQYGPGQSIIALPFYALGGLLAGLYPPEAASFVLRAVASWFNPLLTALVAALLFLAGRRLGYGQRASTGAALLYGLATMAWPHSKTFFAEPLVSALIVGAFLILIGERGRRPGWLLLAGLLAGLTAAVKIQAVIMLPIMGLWLILDGRRRTEDEGRRTEDEGRRQGSRSLQAFVFRPSSFAPPYKDALTWAIGAALPLGLLALYQWALYGSPLRTGYGGNVLDDFSTPFWQGLAGQLLSPGRGLLWYAPVTLLTPLGLIFMARRQRSAALFCAAISLAHLLFYAKWIAWDGAGAWGPRFLNTALPFMILPLAALYDQSIVHRRGAAEAERLKLQAATHYRLLRFHLVTLLILTIPVQLGGLAININAFFAHNNYRQLDDYRPSESALVGHLVMAARQLRTHYEVALAPGVALAAGFANTEGQGQLPRWALPEATIALRPPASGPLRASLTLSSCWQQPGPAPLSIALNGLPILVDGAACPPRRYQLLLPAERATLTLSTVGWRPADFGIERQGQLGVYLSAMQVSAAEQPLPIYGYRLPITPMPENSAAQRRWAGDDRFGHWDFWWWYMWHSGLPAGPNAIFATLWLALALGALSCGILLFRRTNAERANIF